MQTKKIDVSIAVVLVHRYDKAGFLSWLSQLDEVLPSHHQLFIYDAATVDAERLNREDVQRVKTPMQLLYGQDQSTASMYNALFRSIPPSFTWTFLVEDVVLIVDWMERLVPYLSQSSYGLWRDGLNMVIRTYLLHHLKGFEERYFYGSMIADDFSWRVRRLGHKTGVISPPHLLGTTLRLYQPYIRQETALYYAVRNDWLFARLRLSWWQKIIYLLPRLWLQGVVKKGLWRSDYRRAVFDGWKILGTSPVIHHDRKVG